jgi:two-component system cell cycle sensor histidine kinase/response regulator CckA
VFANQKRAAQILVVDDEPIVRRFIVATLQSRGFVVVEASSGQEGLKYFSERNGVDLVLTDILMPIMSGPEMIQHIVKIDPSVKIMFMTGTDPDRRLMDFHDKHYLLLHKPFTLDKLIKSVQDCLAN